MGTIAHNFVVNKKKTKDFGASQWKHLFKLLGLMVASDKRIVPEEVDVYVSSLMELRVIVDPKIVLTKHMIKEWLLLNKQNLIHDIDSLEYDTILLNTLNEIKYFPHKLDVVTAMLRIAVADDNYTPMKHMLIKKTILYWNIRA